MLPAEQLPMPCPRCGGPMAEAGTTPHPATIQLTCPYCGTTDTLPADAQARVHALRLRLQSLWWAKDALHGQDAQYCQQFEHTWIPGTLKALIGPLSICTFLGVGMAASSGDWRAGLLGLGLASAFLTVALGMAGGFWVAKHRYHTTLRPWILARVPTTPGAPARCYCCGGNLPVAQDAFVPCSYCGATNLVTAARAEQHGQSLEREAAIYRARAAGAAQGIQQHLAFVRKAIAGGYYIAFAVMVAAGAIVVLVLRALR